MAFKMVTDSEKAAGRVAGTALAHAGEIAAQQTEKWRDQLGDGQETVDVEQLQRFHAEELQRLRQEMREREQAHLEQLGEIRQARERRDAAVPRLRGRLYALRDLFQGVYGDEGPLALFAGKPAVPVDATPLRRVARIVVDKLLDRDLALPPATLKGTRLKRKTLAAEISDPLAELEAAMNELEEMLPLANRTLARKRQAHTAVNDKTAAFGRFLEGLYGLEGNDMLAAKVRPSSHRSKKEEAGAPESAEAAPASAAPAAEPERLEPVRAAESKPRDPGTPGPTGAAADRVTTTAGGESSAPTTGGQAMRSGATR